jgi:formylglycine-generating enzyme required for sulfatase activity/tRNA A-37 threonylcarbamoyl transferase component Bud32
MTCPRCQKQLESDSPECPYCGFDPASEVTLPASVPAAFNDSLINLVLDDKYQLVKFLGKGAMGGVYRARRLKFGGSDVAIKILHSDIVDHPGMRKRFEREATAAATLSEHSNIVTIIDFEPGEADKSLAYIVMELLEGKALSDILKEETTIGLDRAVSLMCDVCDAVNFAHDKGVVHRDLKPANIVVLPMGSGRKGETVKIVDFGLAKLRPTQMPSMLDSLTPIGMMLGTPWYMPPEAYRGEQLDARSDIYSLGATIYHMLSGRPPFMAVTIPELQYKHLNEKPPSLLSDGRLPLALEQVIMQALEKDPDKRPQKAITFAEELRTALQSPVPRPSVIMPALSEFTFEVARVESSGKVIERTKRKARYFKERIDSELIELVEIPGGSFVMGSPSGENDRHDDEGPQRVVNVKSFYMGKYEITQAQWRVIAASEKITRDLIIHPSHFRGDKKPIERVSWYDAVEFCLRLSRMTGREYRLPSEAEWEYACRAGMESPFCLGENICEEAVNHNGNFPYGKAPKGQWRSTTTAVGSLGVANNFGLYDMLGNVWEWCQDVYHSNYEDAPTDGSAWLGGDYFPRVIRGGSWRAPAVDCGSAARNNNDPHIREDDIGFRVVCSATGPVIHSSPAPLPLPVEPVPNRTTTKAIDGFRGFIDRLRIREWSSRLNQLSSVFLNPATPAGVFLFLVLTHVLIALITIDLFVPSIFQNALEPAFWGFALGGAQALLLRRYLPAAFWWILITMAGAIVSGMIYQFLGLPWELTWSYVWGNAKDYPFFDRSTTVIVCVALRWWIVSIMQWLVLRRFVTTARRWPITTLGASLLCGLVISALSRQMRRDDVFAAFVVCAALFLGSAQALSFLHFKKKGSVPG